MTKSREIERNIYTQQLDTHHEMYSELETVFHKNFEILNKSSFNYIIFQIKPK